MSAGDHLMLAQIALSRARTQRIEAIALALREGMTWTAIGAKLGMSDGAARRLWDRAQANEGAPPDLRRAA